MPPTLDLVIFFVMAVVVALGIQLYRARRANRSQPIGQHDLLMKRAEAHAKGNAFLTKACKDYRANRHLSPRQVEAVETALERLERKKAR
jgi:hypothetical protein